MSGRVGRICGLIVVLIGALAPRTPAAVLFTENFNGYTHFPLAIPAGDPINPGLPEVSEGSQSFWYAGRFEPGGGTIDSDITVQRWGSSLNETPAGRFEDGAGLVFRIDTTNHVGITLDFDWRTFAVQPFHRFVVGYHIGDDLGFNTTTNRMLDLNWANWVELLRNVPNDSFKHETFQLPGNVGPLYVAFWIAGDETHYGKIDNIIVNSTQVIPEPRIGLLAVLLLCFAATRRASISLI